MASTSRWAEASRAEVEGAWQTLESVRSSTFPEHGEEGAGAISAGDTQAPWEPSVRAAWVQHLSDLGFLEVTANPQGAEVAAAALDAAILSYRAADTHLHPHGAPSLEEAPPNAGELDRLTDLTGLDGELSEVSLSGDLRGRVYAYRLRMIGQEPQDSHGPSETQRAYLRLLLGVDAGESLFTLLGDAWGLLRRLLRRRGFDPLWLPPSPDPWAARDAPNPVSSTTLVVMDERCLRLDVPLLVTRLRLDGRLDAAEQAIAHRNRVEVEVGKATNRLGLSLVRLLLWMNGYLQRQPAGPWDLESEQALQEAIAGEDVEPGRVLRTVERGCRAFEPHPLLAALERREARAQPELVLVAHLEAEATSRESVSPLRRTGLAAAMRLVGEKIAAAARWVYRGAKTAIISAIRGLQRGVRWVEGAAGRAGAHARNLCLAVFPKIRRTLDIAGGWLRRYWQFVSCQPMVSKGADGRAAVVTRFEPDRDAVTLVDLGMDRESLLAHGRMCHRMAWAVRQTLKFAVELLLSIADIYAGPAGWLRIAMRLVKLVVRIATGPAHQPLGSA